MRSNVLKAVVAAVLSVSLGGCLGGTSSVGGGAGASVERDGSVDSSSESGGSGADVAANEAKPQAGGVAVIPAEHGGEAVYGMEGEVEPVCRLSSDKIQYRFQGTVYRKEKGIGGEFVASDTCRTNLVTVRFWNGKDCESHKIPVEDCKFNSVIASEQMDVYNLYWGAAHASLSPEMMGHISQSDDSSDASSAPPAAPPVALPSAIASSQLSHPIFKDLVDYQPVCKFENRLSLINHLVNVPASEDLPECGVDNKLMKLPIKAVF